MQRHRLLCVTLCAWTLAVSTQALAHPEVHRNSPATIDIDAHVSEASQRFGLPMQWIYAVMRIESAGEIRAVSHAGAMGLMQLMPRTWARQRTRLGLGNDPFDPRDNILAGTAYLREMYDSYGNPGFLAAYNAGPGRYQEWRDKGRPLPAETRAYVAKVAPWLHAESTTPADSDVPPMPKSIKSWTHSALFPVRADPKAASRTERAGDSDTDASTAAPRYSDPVFAPITLGKPQ